MAHARTPERAAAAVPWPRRLTAARLIGGRAHGLLELTSIVHPGAVERGFRRDAQPDPDAHSQAPRRRSLSGRLRFERRGEWSLQRTGQIADRAVAGPGRRPEPEDHPPRSERGWRNVLRLDLADERPALL